MIESQTEIIAVRSNYLTVMEVRALRSWANKLGSKDQIAINVGAGAGTSALALLEGHPQLRVVSIDYDPLRLRDEKTVVYDAGFNGRLAQICNDSAEEGRSWTLPVDLVFIDGDHTYDHVKADLQSWMPHIRDGGILCGHDYGWDKWDGVKQAFDEETIGLSRIGLVDHLIGYFV